MNKYQRSKKISVLILFVGIILCSQVYVSCKEEATKVISTVNISSVINISADYAASGEDVTTYDVATESVRGISLA